MSELAATSELRAVVGELRRQQVMDLVRGAAFVGTLLLAWITLHPFVDLGNQQLKDTTTGNETMTYVVFGGLAVLMVVLAMRDNMRGPRDPAHAGLSAVRRLDRRHGRAVAGPQYIDQALRPDGLRDGRRRDAAAVGEIAE